MTLSEIFSATFTTIKDGVSDTFSLFKNCTISASTKATNLAYSVFEAGKATVNDFNISYLSVAKEKISNMFEYSKNGISSVCESVSSAFKASASYLSSFIMGK